MGHVKKAQALYALAHRVSQEGPNERPKPTWTITKKVLQIKTRACFYETSMKAHRRAKAQKAYPSSKQQVYIAKESVIDSKNLVPIRLEMCAPVGVEPTAFLPCSTERWTKERETQIFEWPNNKET